jgi:hypothetical protein
LIEAGDLLEGVRSLIERAVEVHDSADSLSIETVEVLYG